MAKKKHKTARERFTVVVVAILAVLMVLSILLPSLSSIFMATAQKGAASSAQSAVNTDAAITSMSDVDERYGKLVEEYKTTLASDSNDLAALLNLGNSYMAWAGTATSFASDDAGKAHVNDLYKQSMDAYDKYLALNDSADVYVRRTMAQYYSGDTDAALASMEKYTAGAGKDYGPAWAYLGLMYQTTNNTEKAKEAYNSAISVDADDAYGAKSFAQNQLASMEGTSSDATNTNSNSTGQSLQSLLGGSSR
ncbi:tetratricopeptide repeat protein [Atopobium fossor]|uniref:tetratricopeptide repeat protein n=1 Tax=Atopobium fossor TaxID=39487 RepID=UPI0003FCE6BE|nr:DUF4044 domain-containing protein [Atopobium fossor]